MQACKYIGSIDDSLYSDFHKYEESSCQKNCRIECDFAIYRVKYFYREIFWLDMLFNESLFTRPQLLRLSSHLWHTKRSWLRMRTSQWTTVRMLALILSRIQFLPWTSTTKLTITQQLKKNLTLILIHLFRTSVVIILQFIHH